MKLPSTSIPEIEQFNEEFTMRHTIWNIRDSFGTNTQKWYNDNFKDLDAEAIVEEVDARNTELLRLQKKLGFDAKDAVLDAAKGEVAKVKDQKRLIESLGNKALKPKHMTEIWSLLPDGHPGDPMVFTLQLMVDKNIEQHMDRVEEIAGKAAGESKIQEQMAEINETWSTLPFPIDNYRGMKDRFIINKDIEEVNQLLEDA
jgi:dynein heavy chain